MSLVNKFIHLRTYSTYSLLSGTINIPDLVEHCVRNKMPAVAVTDTGNMFGALEFSMYASDRGLQPIIGIVLHLKTDVSDSNTDEVLLIAKNNDGYQNLLKIAGEYYRDENNYISFDYLKMHADGLISLTSGQHGTLGKLLLKGQKLEAENFLLELNAAFKDNLYIELMRHGFREEQEIEPDMLSFGLKHNIPFVATNRVYFLSQDMHEAHDILWCIADGKYLPQEDRRKSIKDFYLKSEKEMIELFSDIPEAIQNSVVIAKRCSVKAEPSPVLFPKYEVTLGATANEELEILSNIGLEKRLSIKNLDGTPLYSEEDREEYKKRLNYELEVINKMQFASYLLIVSDFIRWAKSQNIPVGPGRGSGAGSIVSWSVEITDVDPIKFGLLFERFLNPERISMPDLDIDFCQDRRDEVISYVRDKYGKKRVAHIITFGKLQAKAVLRDVGRVLQMPYSIVDRIAKMIPFNAVTPVTLKQAIELEPELKKAQKQDASVAKLISIALKLEGINRHASTHAAGVVIGDRDLDELVPFYHDSKSMMPVIQYSMKYAEAAGLIKFDFLGLKTLTVISKSTELIRKQNSSFDIALLPLDDEKVFEMLSRGHAIGVFQFESPGMRTALSKMKPDSIEDIIALGALYRPGPMDNIPKYIDCKHGKIQPDYIHPSLEKTLKKTFGVIIYQEQVIEIAKIIAGYSLGAADLLRRAMGKKIKEEMDAQREIFTKGALQKGVSQERAGYIFDLVAKFAGYGFNRAHAVAYGMISYQTAFLKAHYPVEFIASMLNTEIYDTDKINTFVCEAKNLGIVVVMPDINKSGAEFEVVEKQGVKKILYALGAIKNISFDLMTVIYEERRQNGKYKDIYDFILRAGHQINRRQLEFLIKAGAFDSLSSNRKQLFESLGSLLTYGQNTKLDTNTHQISLFDNDQTTSCAPLVEVEDWGDDEKLNNECAALGFYLSKHPLSKFSDHFKAINTLDASSLRESLPKGVFNVKISGIPVTIKNRSSPRGRYILVSISTPTGMLEVTIFDDKILEANRDSIYAQLPLIIEAEVRKDEDIQRITATKIYRLDEYLKRQSYRISISLDNNKKLKMLQKVICKNTSEPKHLITLNVKTSQESLVTIELSSDYAMDLMNEIYFKIPKEDLELERL